MKEMLNELLMADKTLIHVPFGNGLFDIYKSTVVSWIVLAILIVLFQKNIMCWSCFCYGRK